MDDQASDSLNLGASANAGSLSQDCERNDVFAKLVTADNDIVGLVAYSIYKQNKFDWLQAFNRAKGREPSDDEIAAYIVGEGTARRLATYRHLAHATLEGRGPDVPLTFDQSRPFAMVEQRSSALQRATSNRFTVIVMIALVAIAAVLGFFFARYSSGH
jgi:hypothetical protein